MISIPVILVLLNLGSTKKNLGLIFRKIIQKLSSPTMNFSIFSSNFEFIPWKVILFFKNSLHLQNKVFFLPNILNDSLPQQILYLFFARYLI